MSTLTTWAGRRAIWPCKSEHAKHGHARTTLLAAASRVTSFQVCFFFWVWLNTSLQRFLCHNFTQSRLLSEPQSIYSVFPPKHLHFSNKNQHKQQQCIFISKVVCLIECGMTAWRVWMWAGSCVRQTAERQQNIPEAGLVQNLQLTALIKRQSHLGHTDLWWSHVLFKTHS